jgi:4-alpha-glucanotransferase
MVSGNKLLNSQSGNHWERIGVRHHHGIVAPLFCLRSHSSCGIGEYTDLLPLIDWCTEIGFDIIQLLPINDTGIHTSPYAAISAFALNPIHLGLASLPNISNHPTLLKRITDLQELTKTNRVDYKLVHKKREKFLREYYRLEGQNIEKTQAYQQFITQHDWLPDFALFKSIKEKTQWKPCKYWDNVILSQDYTNDVRYHSFVQYLCFSQMHRIEEIALQKGVLLMGDIPILIGGESADVWKHPNYFNLEYSAGAPPDMFAKNGQKWGFPTYNWKEIENDNYEWWKKRLKVASLFFDVYRIDHIVGFFRIWTVPKRLSGLHGFYVPDDAQEWLALGDKNLSMMLHATEMFPIGEDLGQIPPNVRESLKRLGIPGMKIVRWERNWDVDGSFIPFDQYPNLSMTTLTTHDMEPMNVWWEEKPEEARELCRRLGWEYTPKLTEEKHKQLLIESHRTPSLFHINLLQEYLSLFPELGWADPLEERINTPGTVTSKNWSIRTRPWLEDIVAHEGLRATMSQIISP